MATSVLVTGGRGFFGKPLAAAIAQRGYQVVTPGRPEFDLMDRASVDRTLAEFKPDIVVHSAAYYGGLGITVREPATIFHRNTLMAANLLDAAGQAGVSRFVSIGSACAYAGDVVGDMSEGDYWSGALHPSVEAYGFVKKIHEVGIRAYHKQHGMTGQLPILTNLYGEGDVFTEYRSHVAAALVKKFADAKLRGDDNVVCWGTGAPVREFLHVGDAAEAVARLIQSGEQQPVNIGTGRGTSIKALAELIAREVHFTGRIEWDDSKPDGVMRKVLNVSRMREVLGWQPPTTLEDGMARTIRWYLANKPHADARD